MLIAYLVFYIVSIFFCIFEKCGNKFNSIQFNSNKDTVQCISEHHLNFEQKLDDQFENKCTFQSVLIACLDLFGGPLNNSEKIQIKYIKISKPLLHELLHS